MTDYVAERGGAALGARLRRLSAAIDVDAARIYAAMGLRFEQRWFGVINQLSLNGPMSVSELAAVLGISHASVSETRQSLEKAGLVLSEPDRRDLRRRTLALSRSGEALVDQLRPLWSAFDEVARRLDAEAGGVTQALEGLEQALGRRSLLDRLAIVLSWRCVGVALGDEGVALVEHRVGAFGISAEHHEVVVGRLHLSEGAVIVAFEVLLPHAHPESGLALRIEGELGLRCKEAGERLLGLDRHRILLPRRPRVGHTK